MNIPGHVIVTILLGAVLPLGGMERGLFTAIHEDNLAKAEKLISAGTLQERSASGGSLLHVAAGEGAFRIFRYLVEEKGMDWKEKDRYGATALHKAAAADSVEIIRFLAKRGADLLETDKFGANALHRAAAANALRAVKYFIDERKPDPESGDKFGNTALHKAAAGSALEVLKYLIEDKKLDFHVRNSAGATVLRTAVRNGKLPAAQYLIEKAGMDVQEKNARGETLLFAAVSYYSNPLDLVRYLVDVKKIPVNAVNSAGETALRSAAEFGSVEILKYLLDEKKMNGKETAADGSTLLHAAAARSRLDILKYLIETRGFDPSVRNKGGKTPADVAGQSGIIGTGAAPEEVKQYLLTYSAKTAAAVHAPVKDESDIPRAADAAETNEEGKTEAETETVPENRHPGEPAVQFPVYGNILPNILPGTRGRGMFALMRDERAECSVVVRNQTKNTLRVQIVPLADSWFFFLQKTSFRLGPGQTFKRRLSFGHSARCTGIRVYWLESGETVPKFRDFLCKDAGPVPRTGKVIESIAWNTGKGPLRKTTLESLEDGKRLYEAFEKRDRSAFAGLLKAGADPNARIMDGKLNLDSIFRIICRSARDLPDFKTYLDLMMKSTLDFDSVLFWIRDFPFDDADAPVLKYLLQHDLKPNGRGSGNFTPLDILLMNPVQCTSKMYALLFQYGADPNLSVTRRSVDKNGVIRKVKEPTATLIRLAEGWLPNPEEEAEKSAQTAEFFKILKLFLKAGVKPDTMRKIKSADDDSATENILHYLAKRPVTPAGLEAFRLLLEYGANPNAVDSPGGSTPLFYLVKEDTVRARNAVRLFIKAGADLRIRNADQNTVLNFAEGKMKTLLQHAHDKKWLEPERDRNYKP